MLECIVKTNYNACQNKQELKQECSVNYVVVHTPDQSFGTHAAARGGTLHYHRQLAAYLQFITVLNPS